MVDMTVGFVSVRNASYPDGGSGGGGPTRVVPGIDALAGILAIVFT
jgi:hypothetical protein